jgi:hypothetical protein
MLVLVWILNSFSRKPLGKEHSALPPSGKLNDQINDHLQFQILYKIQKLDNIPYLISYKQFIDINKWMFSQIYFFKLKF